MSFVYFPKATRKNFYTNILYIYISIEQSDVDHRDFTRQIKLFDFYGGEIQLWYICQKLSKYFRGARSAMHRISELL
jgi:hypothetical protein